MPACYSGGLGCRLNRLAVQSEILFETNRDHDFMLVIFKSMYDRCRGAIFSEIFRTDVGGVFGELWIYEGGCSGRACVYMVAMVFVEGFQKLS